MLRYLMALIIAVGMNMKWMMTLNLCLMFLKNILELNYTYGSLKQPITKNILRGVTIFFISQRMGESGGLLTEKGR